MKMASFGFTPNCSRAIWKILASGFIGGVNLVVMINAAVIIEVIFAWPGIGRLLFEGIFQRDFPLVQGVVVMAGFMIVGINLVVDILYAVIDPRIRLTR